MLEKENREQYEKALYLQHPKYLLLWRVGVATGLRIGDLLKLKANDVIPGPIRITEQKTGKEREAAVPEELRVAVERHVTQYHLLDSDYLFFRRESDKGNHLCRQHVYRVMRLIASKFDFERISPHSMRKTFAAEYFASTGQIEALQSVLNHKHVSTTLLYLFNPLYKKIQFKGRRAQCHA